MTEVPGDKAIEEETKATALKEAEKVKKKYINEQLKKNTDNNVIKKLINKQINNARKEVTKESIKEKQNKEANDVKEKRAKELTAVTKMQSVTRGHKVRADMAALSALETETADEAASSTSAPAPTQVVAVDDLTNAIIAAKNTRDATQLMNSLKRANKIVEFPTNLLEEGNTLYKELVEEKKEKAEVDRAKFIKNVAEG